MRTRIGADFKARVGAARQSIGAGNARKEEKRGYRILLRRQNEAARSGEIIKFRRENLADHRARRVALQRLFHGPECLLGVRRMNEEKAIRIDPEKSEPRSVQRALFERGKILADPDERPMLARRLQTGGERQRETSRSGMIAGLSRDDLVKRTELEAAREHAIKPGMAERNTRRRFARRTRRIPYPGDFLAQKTQPFRATLRFRAAARHPQPLRFVLCLF